MCMLESVLRYGCFCAATPAPYAYLVQRGRGGGGRIAVRGRGEPPRVHGGGGQRRFVSLLKYPPPCPVLVRSQCTGCVTELDRHS